MRATYFAGPGCIFSDSADWRRFAFLHWARRSAGATWEKLIKRLVWIDPNKIEAIALDAVGESGEPRPR